MSGHARCDECEDMFPSDEVEEVMNDGTYCDPCRGKLYKMLGVVNHEQQYERIIPFIIVDASEYAEWLWYDSDKPSMCSALVDFETGVTRPLVDRIKCTDDWADGCCIHTGHIQNEDELKKRGLINYLPVDEKNPSAGLSDEIDEYQPTTSNLPIKWV